MPAKSDLVCEVNHLYGAVKEGRIPLGIFSASAGQTHVRVLAGLVRHGLDFLVLDAEHSDVDDASMYAAVHTISGLGVSPLVRIPGMGSEHFWIKRCLDAGAHGVIVPMVESKAQAEMIVNRAKYGPIGSRGTGAQLPHQAFHRHAYRGQTLTLEEYYVTANEATMIIALIESVAGVENIEEICSVPGLDAIFIGPYDLAQSMGQIPMSDPRVEASVAHVRQIAKQAGVCVMGWAPPELFQKRKSEGFDMLAIGMDTMLLNKAFAAELSAVGGEKRW